MNGITRVVIAAFLVAAGAGLAEAVTPPQNQCTGDCSPCLGPEDPFCSGNPDPIDNTTGKCQTCEATVDSSGHVVSVACVTVNPGELGQTGCTVTVTASKISCQTSGTTCGAASTRR